MKVKKNNIIIYVILLLVLITSDSVVNNTIRMYNAASIPSLTKIQKMKRTVVRVEVDTGHGSGVVVSEDGLIITNKHVIKGSKNIRVIIQEDIYNNVRVVYIAPDLDIAFLKVEPIRDLNYARIKSYDKYTHGDEVYTIGNPLGFNKFVSKGIISKFIIKPNYSVHILTDATILEGSSGGGLFSEDGRLIGVTTATYRQTRKDINHNTRIGFAISSKEFKLLIKILR